MERREGEGGERGDGGEKKGIWKDTMVIILTDDRLCISSVEVLRYPPNTWSIFLLSLLKTNKPTNQIIVNKFPRQLTRQMDSPIHYHWTQGARRDQYCAP